MTTPARRRPAAAHDMADIRARAAHNIDFKLTHGIVDVRELPVSHEQLRALFDAVDCPPDQAAAQPAALRVLAALAARVRRAAEATPPSSLPARPLGR